MEKVTAIGYAVRSPETGMFLGRNGAWFSDLRLASIFAEPGKAKGALNRNAYHASKVVVEVKMSSEGSVEAIKIADPIKPTEPETKPVPQPSQNGPARPQVKAPAKSA